MKNALNEFSYQKIKINKKSFFTLIILFVYMQICVWHSWLCVCVRLLPYCILCVHKNIRQKSSAVHTRYHFYFSFFRCRSLMLLFSSFPVNVYLLLLLLLCVRVRVRVFQLQHNNSIYHKWKPFAFRKANLLKIRIHNCRFASAKKKKRWLSLLSSQKWIGMSP